MRSSAFALAPRTPALVPPGAEDALEHRVHGDDVVHARLRGRLLELREGVERGGDGEAPQRPALAVEVPPSDVRRRAWPEPAAEEAERVEHAPVIGDARVGREGDHLLEREPGRVLAPALQTANTTAEEQARWINLVAESES
jgi:hypothetical protein